MEVLDQLNSTPLYLISSGIILFVVVMSLFFLIRAYRAGIAIGMDRTKLKRTVTSSITFSILPSISILLGVIALSGSLGIPLPWLRLSVIGALHYETSVADIAARNTGLDSLNAEQMTPTAFTTIAFTMQQGSQGFNVLPQEASVCANLRFIPHQPAKESLQVLGDLAEKYGIEMEVVKQGEPSPSLDLQGEGFLLVQDTIHKIFPGVGVLPYVVTGATDARFYSRVCDHCVRFSPVNYGPEQMAGMHGLNENIESGCLPAAVDYYKAIIEAQERRG